MSSYVDNLPNLENVDIKWLKKHLEEQRNVGDRPSKIAYEHLKDVMKDKLLRKNFRQLLSSKKIKVRSVFVTIVLETCEHQSTEEEGDQGEV